MLGGDTERSAGSTRTCTAMRNMDEEGVQHRLLAKLGRGKNPDLKKRQTGAITTWTNHNPGKAKSKVLHPNPAGKKDGAV